MVLRVSHNTIAYHYMAIRKEKKEAIRHAKLEEDQVPVIESTDDLPAANKNKADLDM
ncbi:hypothetical protein FOZ62_026090 [Perkinsus olseni]|uniref:Uncharacterized protein n=1 Tax=Perkinsus olseni TaxID=32597 RepID=A0A7J6PC71_PEROL|nr:hypothetical protein FOZ62_026090 [Perkinsus olseni]